MLKTKWSRALFELLESMGGVSKTVKAAKGFDLGDFIIMIFAMDGQKYGSWYYDKNNSKIDFFEFKTPSDPLVKVMNFLSPQECKTR